MLTFQSREVGRDDDRDPGMQRFHRGNAVAFSLARKQHGPGAAQGVAHVRIGKVKPVLEAGLGLELPQEGLFVRGVRCHRADHQQLRLAAFRP